MRRYALSMLVLIAALGSNRGNAAVIALACNDCSVADEQRQAMMPWGVGYVFVYDLPEKRLRKFEVAPAPGDAKPRERPKAVRIDIADPLPDSDPSVGAAKPVARRELWEHPVDASVQRIFDTIVAVEARAPGVLKGAKPLQVPLVKLGANPQAATSRPYDPREIAWFSGPARGATFDAFVSSVESGLASAANAARIGQDLADVFYGIRAATLKVSVDVGTAKPATGVAWEALGKKIRLQFCDAQATCVELAAYEEAGGRVRADYVDARDRELWSLPNAEQARALSAEWPAYRSLDGMYAYAEWLRAERNASIEDVSGGKACQLHSLVCKPGKHAEDLSCRMDCY